MQCARYAYGVAGVMDADEFSQWQMKDVTPIASEVDLDQPKRKSAAQSKRDGDGEKFNALLADIGKAETLDVLDELLNGNDALMSEAPPSWERLIEDAIETRRSEIVAQSVEAA